MLLRSEHFPGKSGSLATQKYFPVGHICKGSEIVFVKLSIKYASLNLNILYTFPTLSIRKKICCFVSLVYYFMNDAYVTLIHWKRSLER